MGRKPKSKEHKDEKRRIRQVRYYQRHKKVICEKRMQSYWEDIRHHV
jgi:hypothetical protein